MPQAPCIYAFRYFISRLTCPLSEHRKVLNFKICKVSQNVKDLLSGATKSRKLKTSYWKLYFPKSDPCTLTTLKTCFGEPSRLVSSFLENLEYGTDVLKVRDEHFSTFISTNGFHSISSRILNEFSLLYFPTRPKEPEQNI